jgi:Family of unknown function (DUF695)/Regulator of ribonuclease activity B
MSDHWEQFPCTMGDHTAFISYDHGIREELASLDFPNFASFKIELLAADDQGLPNGDEFAKLNEIENYLCSELSGAEGVQVGRITTNGRRYFHFYTLLTETVCDTIAQHAATLHGHSIDLLHEIDPERRHYWNELFPTEDDWQVIQDLRVQEALERAGDMLRIARPIEHWVYFRTEAERSAFVDRVKHAFDNVELYESPDARDGPFTARLTHTGIPDYRSMNSTTLLLSRSARENGGKYDGWETQACKV